MSPFLYPVALNLRGRRCVVVGAGPAAARKIVGLIESGADVTVVAPAISPEIETLAAESPIHFVREPFAPEHLEGAFLVIAITNRPDINQQVAETARRLGVLLNLGAPGDDDTASDGDFATMATVRRGDFLLGLTTGGAGPSLSAQLRRQLETLFPDDYKEYVALLGEMRLIARKEIADSSERSNALRRLTSDKTILETLRRDGAHAARVEARRCLFG